MRSTAIIAVTEALTYDEQQSCSVSQYCVKNIGGILFIKFS